jgi:hypothetical protein
MPQMEMQKTDLAAQTPGSSNSDMLRDSILVQQIMTELNGAVSEKGKIVMVIKMVLNLMKKRLLVFVSR